MDTSTVGILSGTGIVAGAGVAGYGALNNQNQSTLATTAIVATGIGGIALGAYGLTTMSKDTPAVKSDNIGQGARPAATIPPPVPDEPEASLTPEASAAAASELVAAEASRTGNPATPTAAETPAAAAPTVPTPATPAGPTPATPAAPTPTTPAVPTAATPAAPTPATPAVPTAATPAVPTPATPAVPTSATPAARASAKTVAPPAAETIAAQNGPKIRPNVSGEVTIASLQSAITESQKRYDAAFERAAQTHKQMHNIARSNLSEKGYALYRQTAIDSVDAPDAASRAANRKEHERVNREGFSPGVQKQLAAMQKSLNQDCAIGDTEQEAINENLGKMRDVKIAALKGDISDSQKRHDEATARIEKNFNELQAIGKRNLSEDGYAMFEKTWSGDGDETEKNSSDTPDKEFHRIKSEGFSLADQKRTDELMKSFDHDFPIQDSEKKFMTENHLAISKLEAQRPPQERRAPSPEPRVIVK